MLVSSASLHRCPEPGALRAISSVTSGATGVRRLSGRVRCSPSRMSSTLPYPRHEGVVPVPYRHFWEGDRSGLVRHSDELSLQEQCRWWVAVSGHPGTDYGSAIRRGRCGWPMTPVRHLGWYPWPCPSLRMPLLHRPATNQSAGRSGEIRPLHRFRPSFCRLHQLILPASPLILPALPTHTAGSTHSYRRLHPLILPSPSLILPAPPPHTAGSTPSYFRLHPLIPPVNSEVSRPVSS